MKVAVTGWYGRGNIGDELLALSALEALKEMLPRARLTLLTEQKGPFCGFRTCRPLYLKEKSPTIRAARVLRHAIVSGGTWPRLALGLDLVVVGGGSLFHDRQNENLIAWKETLSLYKSLGSAVAFYGVTVDPVRSVAARLEQVALLDLADSISVRDRNSQKLVAELIGADRVALAADPVLNCRMLPEHIPVRAPAFPPRIGFNLRPLGNLNAAQLVSQGSTLVRQLYHKLGAQITFVPMWAGDVPIGMRIAEMAGLSDGYRVMKHDPQDLKSHIAEYANFDLVIAMRLHMLELALRCGVPALGLQYDPKVRALLNEVELGNFCHEVSDATGSHWRGLDCDTIVAMAESLLATWPSIGPGIRELLGCLRERERRNIESIRNLMC